MSTKTKRQHRVQFWCDTCKQGGGPGMDGKELIAHLETVHSIKRPFKGKKTGIAFLDGGDGYSNTYALDVNGVKLTELATGPRVGGWMAEPEDVE